MSDQIFCFNPESIDAHLKTDMDIIYENILNQILLENSTLFATNFIQPTNDQLDDMDLKIEQKLCLFGKNSSSYTNARKFVDKFQ